MPERFIRVTMSVGEAERIAGVLYDAHFEDDAEMFTDAIEDGPFLSAADVVAEGPTPLDALAEAREAGARERQDAIVAWLSDPRNEPHWHTRAFLRAADAIVARFSEHDESTRTPA